MEANLKIVSIIQARMGSTRLPGKVLKKLVGKPAIEILLTRLSRSKLIDEICLATSNNVENDILCHTVEKLGYRVVRGSETDVVQRFWDATNATSADVIVRITGDCPVVDPSLVSASDDADGDGVSNIAEILLNTSPSNTNDEPTASGSSSIDGTDFVFEFVRLKSSSLAFSVASVVVECADETFTFSPVLGVDYGNLPLSADQTGITSDYERVEYRVDTSSIDCNFFRLSAQ